MLLLLDQTTVMEHIIYDVILPIEIKTHFYFQIIENNF